VAVRCRGCMGSAELIVGRQPARQAILRKSCFLLSIRNGSNVCFVWVAAISNPFHCRLEVVAVVGRGDGWPVSDWLCSRFAEAPAALRPSRRAGLPQLWARVGVEPVEVRPAPGELRALRMCESIQSFPKALGMLTQEISSCQVPTSGSKMGMEKPQSRRRPWSDGIRVVIRGV
jgi:hypothetical protein